MKHLFIFFSFITISLLSNAQKKPLSHDVYDGWQSIGERKISKDGKWILYSINLQEGDDTLVIQSADNKIKKIIDRGFGAEFSENNKFVIFRIKPLFNEIREAKIKKKKIDENPKDSLGILELVSMKIKIVPSVKNFSLPNKRNYLVYHLEKKPVEKPKAIPDNKQRIDSLQRKINSLITIIKRTRNRKNRINEIENLSGLLEELNLLNTPAKVPVSASNTSSGTNLAFLNLENGIQEIYADIMEYQFSKDGNYLLMKKSRLNNIAKSKPMVLYLNTTTGIIDTLIKNGNDYKQFGISEDGHQVAFLAETDSKQKDNQKSYNIWYFNTNMDTAIMLFDKHSIQQTGKKISEYRKPYFSKSGKRLFFGSAPLAESKDSTLVEMDLVKLDVWHYKDDYLQTQQLSTLSTDLRRSDLLMYDLNSKKILQLSSQEIPGITTSNNGDGKYFAGISDINNRIQVQWSGSSLNDIYAINSITGEKRLLVENLKSRIYVSAKGNFITWYDYKKRHYFSYDGKVIRNITKNIKVPLFNENNDVPNDPAPYGIVRWLRDDEAVLIYDRYDIWLVDPQGIKKPVNITGGTGRKNKTTYRYIHLDAKNDYIEPLQTLLLSTFNEATKENGIARLKNASTGTPISLLNGNFDLKSVLKAENEDVFIYTKENYIESPNIYINKNWKTETRISNINQQQSEYNWGTVELYHWKSFDGKNASGLLYKPEDFDPNKKYPVLFYFYEKVSDNLFQYISPRPTGSKINIPFFVSRGYIVMTPDIHYSIGHPAKDAYNYIVSGARELSKNKWIDAENMGIQGQSWGGIQVAQLITMTDMFKAAWAGAPVANMTSAYGGIRWQGGKSRQFQYEKTQSRIGATLWERPDLYIENSPLFHLPKVKTPLVIMHNDADGAVPWYQGIELFNGLRRLGKQVWLLNYNGEAHNLVQRKNQKDISIREQQFFDYMLKGEEPSRWITEGVKAINKGKDWGLELITE